MIYAWGECFHDYALLVCRLQCTGTCTCLLAAVCNATGDSTGHDCIELGDNSIPGGLQWNSLTCQTDSWTILPPLSTNPLHESRALLFGMNRAHVERSSGGLHGTRVQLPVSAPTWPARPHAAALRRSGRPCRVSIPNPSSNPNPSGLNPVKFIASECKFLS